MYRHAYIFYCVNLRESVQSLIPCVTHKMSPLETAVWKLFISQLCCGCFSSPQCSKQDPQWHHSVELNHPLIWAATPALSTESCWGHKPQSWLGHSCSGGLQNGSVLFLSGLELPFLFFPPRLYLPPPPLHFCPLTTLSQSVTDTGNGVGAVTVMT